MVAQHDLDRQWATLDSRMAPRPLAAPPVPRSTRCAAARKRPAATADGDLSTGGH